MDWDLIILLFNGEGTEPLVQPLVGGWGCLEEVEVEEWGEQGPRLSGLQQLSCVCTKGQAGEKRTSWG